MLSASGVPPFGFGPGSRRDPGDTNAPDVLALPSAMRTFAPHVPDRTEAEGCAAALAVLRAVGRACAAVAESGAPVRVPLAGLPARDRALLDDTLREGEVSARLDGAAATRVQEAVFAGVWRVSGPADDAIEIGPGPLALAAGAFAPVIPAEGLATPRAPGVVNGPAIAAELLERAADRRPGAEAHVVNLTLLPHTPEDLAWLDAAFGRGAATLLSRGYGNCRIEATAIERLWRVRFFNSMDVLILDTFEVVEIPAVALAAPEDLADSARRIADVVRALS